MQGSPPTQPGRGDCHVRRWRPGAPGLQRPHLPLSPLAQMSLLPRVLWNLPSLFSSAPASR